MKVAVILMIGAPGAILLGDAVGYAQVNQGAIGMLLIFAAGIVSGWGGP